MGGDMALFTIYLLELRFAWKSASWFAQCDKTKACAFMISLSHVTVASTALPS